MKKGETYQKRSAANKKMMRTETSEPEGVLSEGAPRRKSTRLRLISTGNARRSDNKRKRVINKKVKTSADVTMDAFDGQQNAYLQSTLV